MMHERRESDGAIVPKSPSNKEKGKPDSAEVAEGRAPAKENPGQVTKCRTQGRGSLQQAEIIHSSFLHNSFVPGLDCRIPSVVSKIIGNVPGSIGKLWL